MADKVLPETYDRVLLVEGKDDFSFFLTLLKKLELDKTIRIYCYCGKDNLAQGISNVVQDGRFEELKHLGIVRDADFDTDALSSVRSSIDRVNRETGRELARPETHMEPAGESPKVSTIILPDEGVEGMLEDLVLSAYSEDPVSSCVEDYFTCLEERRVTLNKTVLPKARVRVFIAGKVVDDEGFGRDRDSWELRYAFRSDWWSWDSPAFNKVKAYLTQLAS